MFSESPRKAILRPAHLVPCGSGYRVTAPGLYVWEDSLTDALIQGAEIGALPAHFAWHRGQPAPSPASVYAQRATRRKPRSK